MAMLAATHLVIQRPQQELIDGAGDSTALVPPVSTPFHVAFPLFLLSVAEPDSRTGQDRTVGHKAVSLNHASSVRPAWRFVKKGPGGFEPPTNEL